MNIVSGTTHQKKTTTRFGPQSQSPAASSPAKQAKATTTTTKAKTTKSGGCCRGLNDCMSMGSIVSTNRNKQETHQQHHHHHSHSIPKLEQQVIELEKEVQKQKEMRVMYKMRLERTQDYLKYCLQIAQDNGFLHLIVNNKDDDHQRHHQSLPSSDSFNYANASPPIPSPAHHHSDLASLTIQAKANGWYVDPCEIKFKDKIGQGSTADIFRATWRGVDVAVKCIFPAFFHSNQSGVSFFAQELETLSKQRHRFVLQLMGACLNPPDHGWVVTEFLSMTLKEWLHGPCGRRKERVIPLPPLEERVAKALEIAQAMQYLHEQNPRLIHRDLKPSNIFLDDASHVRVADFGHARFLHNNEMALTGETGTYVYMAPEVIRCEPYNEKCDVYSFGIILNELMTGNYPYVETEYSPTKIAMEVTEGKLRPALPEDNGGQIKEVIELICLSWDGDASIRPSFAHITSTLKKVEERFKEYI